MPRCPKCETEYRDGFDTCADCGEALVSDDPRVVVPSPQIRPWHWSAQVLVVALIAVVDSIVAIVAFTLSAAALVRVGAHSLRWTPEWLYLGMSCLLAVNAYAVVALWSGYAAGHRFTARCTTNGWLIGFLPVWFVLFAPLASLGRTTAYTGLTFFVFLVVAPVTGAVAMILGATYRERRGRWILVWTAAAVAFGSAALFCWLRLPLPPGAD